MQTFLVIYSVWHLVVQIWFKFFQSQNQFSHNWLNLQSNKKSFAHYILPRVQKNFCLLICLAILEKTEWVMICSKLISRNIFHAVLTKYLSSKRKIFIFPHCDMHSLDMGKPYNLSTCKIDIFSLWQKCQSWKYHTFPSNI